MSLLISMYSAFCRLLRLFYTRAMLFTTRWAWSSHLHGFACDSRYLLFLFARLTASYTVTVDCTAAL